jgi:hypothetical protein
LLFPFRSAAQRVGEVEARYQLIAHQYATLAREKVGLLLLQALRLHACVGLIRPDCELIGVPSCCVAIAFCGVLIHFMWLHSLPDGPRGSALAFVCQSRFAFSVPSFLSLVYRRTI